VQNQEKERQQQAEQDEVLPSFPLPGQQSRVSSDSRDSNLSKSETELQLWALIDMLVQSKTIVKKAAGELGSEGKFG
jgi:hypothetical protein